jgi:hypothetical protein
VGWLLGGSVGIGTIAFAVTIGPNVQYFLRLLGVAPRDTAEAIEAGTVEVDEPEPPEMPEAADVPPPGDIRFRQA